MSLNFSNRNFFRLRTILLLFSAFYLSSSIICLAEDDDQPLSKIETRNLTIGGIASSAMLTTGIIGIVFCKNYGKFKKLFKFKLKLKKLNLIRRFSYTFTSVGIAGVLATLYATYNSGYKRAFLGKEQTLQDVIEYIEDELPTFLTQDDLNEEHQYRRMGQVEYGIRTEFHKQYTEKFTAFKSKLEAIPRKLQTQTKSYSLLPETRTAQDVIDRPQELQKILTQNKATKKRCCKEALDLFKSYRLEIEKLQADEHNECSEWEE